MTDYEEFNKYKNGTLNHLKYKKAFDEFKKLREKYPLGCKVNYLGLPVTVIDYINEHINPNDSRRNEDLYVIGIVISWWDKNLNVIEKIIPYKNFNLVELIENDEKS